MKEIQDKISKLEVVVNSSMIPQNVKDKAKAEIERLKEEMEAMKEKSEKKEEVKAEKPKKEKKEKAEKKERKEEPKKAELTEKECEDLLAKYKAEREARKERAEKREKQGKPAELTPAETAKKAVDRVTDKIDAKAEKGKSVKSDIKAVFSQFKSAVAELKKYKDEIDETEVRNLIKELESLLSKKKMSNGGGIKKHLNEKELKLIGSDYAYITSGDEDRAIYRLLDEENQKILLPKYITEIVKWEEKNNTPVRFTGKNSKFYKELYSEYINENKMGDGGSFEENKVWSMSFYSTELANPRKKLSNMIRRDVIEAPTRTKAINIAKKKHNDFERLISIEEIKK